MSRAADYQRRAVAAGLCSQCYTEPLATKWRCAGCAAKARARRREKLGFKPWQKGKPGRPPKERPE